MSQTLPGGTVPHEPPKRGGAPVTLPFRSIDTPEGPGGRISTVERGGYGNRRASKKRANRCQKIPLFGGSFGDVAAHIAGLDLNR